jgi:MFS transporter, DHA3 family, macrolide efflux protein
MVINLASEDLEHLWNESCQNGETNYRFDGIETYEEHPKQLSKVAPNIQGRVFATRSMLIQITSATATLIAGPLADSVFEPAMMPGGRLASILGPIFGTGAGAGMAVIYVITALGLLLTGIGGYATFRLRNIETILVDQDN